MKFIMFLLMLFIYSFANNEIVSPTEECCSYFENGICQIYHQSYSVEKCEFYNFYTSEGSVFVSCEINPEYETLTIFDTEKDSIVFGVSYDIEHKYCHITELKTKKFYTKNIESCFGASNYLKQNKFFDTNKEVFIKCGYFKNKNVK